MWFKKMVVPASNETRRVDIVRTWEVRWRSRYGEFLVDTRTEVRVFTSHAEAAFFKTALENAFKLIKHTSGNIVKLTETE